MSVSGNMAGAGESRLTTALDSDGGKTRTILTRPRRDTLSTVNHPSSARHSCTQIHPGECLVEVPALDTWQQSILPFKNRLPRTLI